MLELETEIASFREARERFAQASQQTAALRLLCGIDLEEALARTGERRQRILSRIRRAMERERLKGMRGQAGYDLNRHIALKRSLDRLGLDELSNGSGPDSEAKKQNGARRRRSVSRSSA